MKAKILIVEDEPLIADDLADKVERQGFEVVGIVDEASDAMEVIRSKKPDLALLDVNIEGEIDGIELASKLTIPFIYLTSYYDQKTIDRAKQTNPSGYIVKPFNKKDLIVNLELALAKVGQATQIEPAKPEKLFLRNGQEIVSVMSSEILFIEAYDNYSYVYTENEKFLISHTLKSIEEKLAPFDFRRIHRSYLINFSKVDSISEGYVFIHCHKVQIGKSYKKPFLESLKLL